MPWQPKLHIHARVFLHRANHFAISDECIQYRVAAVAAVVAMAVSAPLKYCLMRAEATMNTKTMVNPPENT